MDQYEDEDNKKPYKVSQKSFFCDNTRSLIHHSAQENIFLCLALSFLSVIIIHVSSETAE